MSAAPVMLLPDLPGVSGLERHAQTLFPDAHRMDVVVNGPGVKAMFVFEDDPYYAETLIGDGWPEVNAFNVDIVFAISEIRQSDFEGARVYYIKVKPAQGLVYDANNTYLGEVVVLRQAEEEKRAALRQTAEADARRAAEKAAAAQQVAEDAARSDGAQLAVLDIQLGDALEVALGKTDAHYASLDRTSKGGTFRRLDNPMEFGFHFKMMHPSNAYATRDDSISVFVSHREGAGVIGIHRETFAGPDMDMALYIAALSERYGAPLFVQQDNWGDARMFWGTSDLAIAQVQKDGQNADCFKLHTPSEKRYDTDAGEVTYQSAQWQSLDPGCGVVFRIDLQKNGVLDFQLVDVTQAVSQIDLMKDLRAGTSGTPKIKF